MELVERTRLDARDEGAPRTALLTDPLERIDVSTRLPDVLQRHRQLEDDWFSQGGRVQDFELVNDPEMIRRLRSLGYVQ